MIPDLAPFRGFLVLGSNQVSSIFDNNLVTGQAQSGLWFGKVRLGFASLTEGSLDALLTPVVTGGRPVVLRQGDWLGRAVGAGQCDRQRAFGPVPHDRL